MRIIVLIVLLISAPLFMDGQTSVEQKTVHFPKHYISVNPLNILLFQQIGITYEFKPGIIGYGITAGYIYPNKQEYSNWFIAGPTSYGSLGYYSGLFIEPQVNLYLTKLKNPKHGGMIYIALKGVYKYMHIDSVGRYAWDTHSDDYYWVYRRQIDNVNIFGGFIDFGFRYVIHHFFFDINIGPGIMSINHKMIIAGEATGPYPIHEINPPRYEELHQTYLTINFTLNFGVAF
jgi:hypothetical protein